MHTAVLARRDFVSRVLSSGIILGGAGSFNAKDSQAAETCFQSNSVESLALCTYFVAETVNRAIVPLLHAIPASTEPVRVEYSKLLGLVSQLLDAAPDLKGNRSVIHIHQAAIAGRASIENVNNWANVEPSLLPAYGDTLSAALDLGHMLDSADLLEQQEHSITLSPKAVDILKQLIQAIRDLAKPIGDVSTSSKILRQASIDALELGSIVEEQIGLAVEQLSRAESETASAKRIEKASANIKEAISALNRIDQIQSEALNVLAGAGAQQLPEKPTSFLRSHIADVFNDIKVDLGSADADDDNTYRNYRIMSAAYRSPAQAPSLFIMVGYILRDILVEHLAIRQIWCWYLAKSVVAHHKGMDRVNRLTEVFKYIRPKGRYDDSESKRREAAIMLNGLLEKYGL